LGNHHNLEIFPMREFSRNRRLTTAAVASLALVATACGSDTTAITANDAVSVAVDTSVTGTVRIAGSSTVGPISELVSEDYSSAAPGVTAPVEITGTGGGFKDRFCLGETVINNASRQIKDSELELCAENGVMNILELKVAIDGMTVMTSTSNDSGVTCLNFNEIYALVGPESRGVESWSDANALVAELGGGANDAFTDVPLDTAGPGTESGTYDSFFELAIEGIAEERAQDTKFRPDWTGNNDDNVIISGLSGNKYSFGWVGFAYFVEVSDQVNAFEIQDEAGTCVAPSADTIASGQYPLSRDLYVYVNLDALDTDDGAAVEGFVDYYLSDAGYELVAEAGYVQLTTDSWDATVAAWDARSANV
jgi:phosphate transport system substrate-binding protein